MFFAQSGHSGDGAVAIFAFGEALWWQIDDRLAGMEVGLAEFQVDDGAALGFEFFGAGEDGERAFAAHDRHSGSYGSHGSPCCSG